MPAEVIVVVGARGGCGASTLAALLARERARRRAGRVALVDLDRGHGGVEVLLGIEEQPGARWPDLARVRGTFSAVDLDGVLPRWDGVEVLGADRRGGAPSVDVVEAVWGALVEGCATVVVDLPARSVVDGYASLVLAARTDLVLVTPQDVLGVSGAVGLGAALGEGAAHVVLRRRGRARVSPSEVGAVLGMPVIDRLPPDRGLAEATDRGLGPLLRPWSPVRRAVGRIAGVVGDGRAPRHGSGTRHGSVAGQSRAVRHDRAVGHDRAVRHG